MRLRRGIIRGATVLATGKAAAQALSLARNVVVARVVGPEDFGIAAIFAITMSLLEMLSDLSMDRLLVQARDGDAPRLQAVAQMLQSAAVAVLGMVLFMFAGPIAAAFDVPSAAWSFRVLAALPVIRGLANLDIQRTQRELAFGRLVVADVGSQALAVAAAYPLGIWLGDFSVALWLLLLQSVAYVAGTHLLATRPYRWAWDRPLAARFLSFGWPLLINGCLLFLIVQGDRVVVGSRWTPYSLQDLGVYSAAVVLTLSPAVMLAAVNRSVMLPLLAPVQDDRKRFAERYRMSVEATAAMGAGLALILTALAGPIISVLYGEAYGRAALVLPWLAIMQGLRVLRGAPSVAAMALADTTNAMWSNVARSLAIPAMIVAAAGHADLRAVVACGIVGEVVALGTAGWRLDKRHALPMRMSMQAAAKAGAVVAAFGLLPSLAFERMPTLQWSVGVAMAALGMTILLWWCKALRAELRRCLDAAWGRSEMGVPVDAGRVGA